MSRDARKGTVLPAAILLLLGATLLAHTAFVLARDQQRLARVEKGLLTAEVAARAGLLRAREVPGDGAPDSLGKVEGSWGPGGRYRVTRDRLGAEVLLLRSQGWASAVPVPVTLGQLLWRLDPVERVLRTDAVVTAAATDPAGVDPGTWWTIPTGADTAACERIRGEVVARGGGAAPAAVRESPEGDRLGRWTLPELIEVAGVAPTGSVTPAPDSVGGRCETSSPDNWGNPHGGVCGNYHPLIGVKGPLTVSGGIGQGIIAAPEHLVFRAGTHFRGLVVAGGSVRVEAGAVVEGTIRAAGPVSVAPGGVVRGSACALGSALAGPAALSRALLLEPGRIPILP